MKSSELIFIGASLGTTVLIATIEGIVLWRRRGYDWKAAGVSLLDVGFRLIGRVFVPLSMSTIFIKAAQRHQIVKIPLNGWLAWTALFFAIEFFYYWLHRANHRIRWFWCNHAVHHAPTDFNLSVSFRIGALERVTGNAIFYAPVVLLGFPVEPMFALVSLSLIYQFWIHSTWIPKLGWLEYVFNTPSAHRVHHAMNLEYLDANYGGILIIFDRIFGTYRAELPEVPCRYGLVKPVESYNPIRVEFQQWWWLARDVARARSLRAVLGAIFMPPGWSADGDGETTEDLRRRARNVSTELVPSPLGSKVVEI